MAIPKKGKKIVDLAVASSAKTFLETLKPENRYERDGLFNNLDKPTLKLFKKVVDKIDQDPTLRDDIKKRLADRKKQSPKNRKA